MRPRIVLVVLITTALLAAAGWAGGLSPILAADRVHSLPFFGGLVALGVASAWMGKWDTVKWFVLLLPICGLVLTSYGILLVAPEVFANADYNTVRAHTIMALAPNCIAGAGTVWLFVLRRICGGPL